MIKTDIPDLFILCGGFGKRARNLDSFNPKILITIKKKPFLYYVLKNLENQGVKNVVLCLGYKSELIKTYIKKNKKKFKINIFFSEEKKPLGTGGAIKKAAHKSKKGFFVMYGDTFLFFDLKKILNYCKYKRAEGVMTIFKNKDENYINNVYYKWPFFI